MKSSLSPSTVHFSPLSVHFNPLLSVRAGGRGVETPARLGKLQGPAQQGGPPGALCPQEDKPTHRYDYSHLKKRYSYQPNPTSQKNNHIMQMFNLLDEGAINISLVQMPFAYFGILWKFRASLYGPCFIMLFRPISL